MCRLCMIETAVAAGTDPSCITIECSDCGTENTVNLLEPFACSGCGKPSPEPQIIQLRVIDLAAPAAIESEAPRGNELN